jgi:predicted 3-demethylubiquinone-9 3-methyltransferase (glyoxalase superfamily)
MRWLHKEHTNMKPKNTICLWFDKDAQEAARFYAGTFPNSEVTAVHEAPGDYPAGKKGDVLTVEFTVLGIPCLGLNGGPEFRHSEAFSFQIATDTQEETDRYWNAIVGNGGKESQCGWCKDRWGLSWQVTPRALTDALAAGGGEAKRAFEAMMPMKKIDIATIEACVLVSSRQLLVLRLAIDEVLAAFRGHERTARYVRLGVSGGRARSFASFL